MRPPSPVTVRWSAALTINPRPSGVPLTTADGMPVGVVMAERDALPSQTPAIRLNDVRAFVGTDLPSGMGSKTDPPYVLKLNALVSK